MNIWDVDDEHREKSDFRSDREKASNWIRGMLKVVAKETDLGQEEVQAILVEVFQRHDSSNTEKPTDTTNKEADEG